MKYVVGWGSCQNEHDFCIVENVVELFDRGFTIYLEYEIFLEPTTRKRIIPDIYAKREEQIVIMEVGSLSEHYAEERLRLLKDLVPNAKVVHVTQWKNWLSQFDWQALEEECRFQKYLKRAEEQEEIE